MLQLLQLDFMPTLKSSKIYLTNDYFLPIQSFKTGINEVKIIAKVNAVADNIRKNNVWLMVS